MAQKQISRDEAIQFLNSENSGHLATCDSMGQPYITPLNYVYLDGSIYFHCAHNGRKLDNIAENERVCFEVSRVDKMVFERSVCKCSTRYTSVLVFGTARIIEDPICRAEILNGLAKKFAAGRHFDQVSVRAAANCTVVEISVDSIHGKKNISGS